MTARDRFWAVTHTLAAFGGVFTGLGFAEGFGNDRWVLAAVLAGFGLVSLGLSAARVWLWRAGRWQQ